LKLLAIILHRGSPHDAPLFEEILEELKRRRIARTGEHDQTDNRYLCTVKGDLRDLLADISKEVHRFALR
jgi:hypothetical protein